VSFSPSMNFCIKCFESFSANALRLRTVCDSTIDVKRAFDGKSFHLRALKALMALLATRIRLRSPFLVWRPI
jgi:hypothetical protein